MLVCIFLQDRKAIAGSGKPFHMSTIHHEHYPTLTDRERHLLYKKIQKKVANEQKETPPKKDDKKIKSIKPNYRRKSFDGLDE
jgi:hypothetical protein